jgi:hypothetical protein
VQGAWTVRVSRRLEPAGDWRATEEKTREIWTKKSAWWLVETRRKISEDWRGNWGSTFICIAGGRIWIWVKGVAYWIYRSGGQGQWDRGLSLTYVHADQFHVWYSISMISEISISGKMFFLS